jgi:hypothetical protein
MMTVKIILIRHEYERGMVRGVKGREKRKKRILRGEG